MALGQNKGFGHSIGLGGFSDWIAPRRNAMLGLASGLLASPDFSSGLSTGFARAADGRQADDAWAERQREAAEREKQIADATALKAKYADFFTQQGRTDIAQGIADGIVDPGAAYMDYIKPKAEAAGPASVQEYEYARSQGFDGSFMDFQTQRGGASEISLTPTWGIDQDQNSPTFGKMVLGQLGKDNKFHRTDMGGVQPIDPATMQGDKARSVIDEKTAGEARKALPGLERAAEIAYDAIDLVTTDEKGLGEQFGNILGVPQRNLPVLPGSSLGNWQANFAQAKGQSFLQAREMLKGGGPITDYEGQKADAAFSRMETAAALGDKENFLLAAKDFKEAIDSGVTKLREVASGGYSAGAPAVGGGTGWKVIGVE